MAATIRAQGHKYTAKEVLEAYMEQDDYFAEHIVKADLSDPLTLETYRDNVVLGMGLYDYDPSPEFYADLDAEMIAVSKKGSV